MFAPGKDPVKKNAPKYEAWADILAALLPQAPGGAAFTPIINQIFPKQGASITKAATTPTDTLNQSVNPSAGIKRYKDRPEFVSMNPVVDATTTTETVQPSFQPSIAGFFGEAVGRAATGDKAQFAFQDQGIAVGRDMEAKKLEAERKRRARQEEFGKKAEDIRKKPKVTKNEALISGLIALLGAAGGATNSQEALQNYLGGMTNKRTDEQNAELTALERQMQSELGMMDDQASQEQLQGKYKLQDIEKFMGRAEYYDKGFKGVDKVRADKKEEAKVKAEKLAEGRLGNIGEAIMKAKNPAEAESWIGKYNDEAIKQGKPPIDDAQRFVIMESVNQKTLADAKEIAYFKAAYDPIDKTIKRYAGAKMPPEVIAELQTRINELNAWGAPRGLTLPSIDPNATPEWEMKTEKALREAKMWDVDFENKKQEGINKKLTAQKTRVDIEAVNQKIREGKATPGDLIYKSFLQGEPVSPEEVKTYLKDKAKVLDNSFETAGSTDPNWRAKAVVNIRTQLDEMAGFLGPDHPAVKQAFSRSKAQGYLDPKYKDMDHAAFSKHWKTGKAIFDQYGQKKKSTPESVSSLFMPLKGRRSSGFGPRTHPVTGEKGKMHYGVDIASPGGSKIYSAGGGVVSRVGFDKNGYGNWIEITHPDGRRTRYGHMKSPSKLKVGQEVGRDTIIGYVGSTGRSTGNHLHFEVRDKNGNPLNPEKEIQR
jgi:murein DD-endopeptidase MepM/ murein hydrolase activator NlpD